MTSPDHISYSGISHTHRSLPIQGRHYEAGTPIKFQIMESDIPKAAIVLKSDYLTLKVSCVGTEFRIFKSMVTEGAYVKSEHDTV
ncbi:MAG: hypothetical protein ACXABY_22275 [Candidatus Thorarchaeota archaeon]|jgi:hypothetical protein